MGGESVADSGETKVVVMHQPAAVGTATVSEGTDQDAVSETTASSKSEAKGRDESLNTDDRELFDWKGHYPNEAKIEIHYEARVIGGILFLTFGLLFLTWRGTAFELLSDGCTTCSRETFDRYAYFYLGGQLGGILFGVKYLYKVVARGRWHLDRRLWRFFSPFLSGGLAFVVGALTDSGVMGLTAKASSGSAYFSLGFIAGYFADSALAKMQEIADTVFGSPAKRH